MPPHTAATDAAATDPSDGEHAIDTHEVAQILGLAEITIKQQRVRGEGPPFFRVGRHVRYVRRDVIAYRDARKVGKAP